MDNYSVIKEYGGLTSTQIAVGCSFAVIAEEAPETFRFEGNIYDRKQIGNIPYELVGHVCSVRIYELQKEKVEVSAENYNKQREITDKIDAILNKIEEDTQLHSSPKKKLEHPGFNELLAMGDVIVNYLFHLMFEYGNSWTLMLLLTKLVKDGPNKREHRGDFKYMTIDWMTWYVESEYYKNCDVYYNLV